VVTITSDSVGLPARQKSASATTGSQRTNESDVVMGEKNNKKELPRKEWKLKE